MKKKSVLVAAALLFIPGSTLAFLGIGDSGDAVLTAIFSELTVQTQVLRGLFGGIDFMDQQISDMRREVDGPIDLHVEALHSRKDILDDVLARTQLSLFGKQVNLDQLKTLVEKVWGKIPATAEHDVLSIKDEQPLYALGHASFIDEEAQAFSQKGEDLLGDLEDASEGKATIRNAQAQALQIQQLAQIEKNQGLQLSLQAQQILSQNETPKAIAQVTDDYLRMLEQAYRRSVRR